MSGAAIKAPALGPRLTARQVAMLRAIYSAGEVSDSVYRPEVLRSLHRRGLVRAVFQTSRVTHYALTADGFDAMREMGGAA